LGGNVTPTATRPPPLRTGSETTYTRRVTVRLSDLGKGHSYVRRRIGLLGKRVRLELVFAFRTPWGKKSRS